MNLEQMHTVEITGRSDNKIIDSITKAGRMAEKWDEAKKNLGLKRSFAETKKEKPRYKERFDKPTTLKKPFQRKEKFQEKNFKMKNESRKMYAEQVEGIDKSELDRRKSAGEYQRCAWPGDAKGSHKTMDCFQWKRMDKGTAPFPKGKDYQKLKVGAFRQEESDIDLYTTDDEESSDEQSSSEDEEEEGEDDLLEDQDIEEIEEPEEQPERNWWDSDSDSE